MICSHIVQNLKQFCGIEVHSPLEDICSMASKPVCEAS